MKSLLERHVLSFVLVEIVFGNGAVNSCDPYKSAANLDYVRAVCSKQGYDGLQLSTKVIGIRKEIYV